MPNHVKNLIELVGPMSEIDALIKKFSTYIPASVKKTHDNKEVICKQVGSEYGFCWMDLKTGYCNNRSGLSQIGLPDDYEIELSDSIFCFPDFDKVIPPPKDDPAYKDEPSQEVAKTSPNWWYTWNSKHWGTKWGGYSYERPAINVFTFETAWASVPKIIASISLAFPNVTINYKWSDEDTGYNCGRAVYKDGLIQETIPEGGSPEAFQIAFELRPDRAEGYELVDGVYKSIEE